MELLNYGRIHLISEASHTENHNIYFIDSAEVLANYDKELSTAAKAKLAQALENEKTIIHTEFSDTLNYYIISPSKVLEEQRQAGANFYAQALADKSTKIDFYTSSTNKESILAFLEGLSLSAYDFDKYKTKKQDFSLTLNCDPSLNLTQDIVELNQLIKAVQISKSLVNEPPNNLDASRFSAWAEEVGKAYGFETEVLGKEKIKSLKMGGLLAVNQGSINPPSFTVMEYKPTNAKNKKPIVLVGKGVTFDTGGYSLKPSNYMSTMKSDMAGAASVVGIMAAIAGNKLACHVIGLVPATDNKISANALVVDDVIRMMDGSSVEVQNTDAEGRLVLADALTYAKRYEPELVIDIATLTGASAAITGSYGISVLGNTEEQITALAQAGEEVYERLIPLPLWKEFGDLLKSDIADLKNIGGPVAGVSTAAKFLEHFTDYPWIHLDIAGASFVEKASGYRQAGATAAPVRLLYQFIKNK